MQKWKQTVGSSATYRNLIDVFKRAGYRGYAEIVRKLVSQSNANTSVRVTMHASLPQPPHDQLLPVFPEREVISSSSIVLPSATAVDLLIEKEYQGAMINTRNNDNTYY